MAIGQVDSYIKRVLQPGENILYLGKVHWIVFAYPAAITVFAMLLLAPVAEAVPSLNILVYVILFGGLVMIGIGYLRQITDELVLTDRRVVSKFGFITRATFELRLEQVEGVQVVQSFLGRILDYGTILVTGTGGLTTPLPLCAAPLRFRQAISEELNRRAGYSATGPAQSSVAQSPPQRGSAWRGL